ncbi:PASTA domain-containing protein [Nonomuraea sp. NPDC050328]|uniref:PASTA domain-containing protein n=1 Tax=Nonomuraea sp. NPDC050328 TaxID=3364361 RepID=UPI00378B4394
MSTVEDLLREAMSREVEDVRGPAGLAAAVRRGSRARRLRARAVGTALVVVAVSGGAAFLLVEPEPAGKNAATSASVVTEVAVPDVVKMPPEQASARLEQAGLKPVLRTDPGEVTSQDPAAGTLVKPGTEIQLYSARKRAQHLGDLGDGRAFGGIRLTYLPDDLRWGRWSVKDTFGVTSYSTTYDEPGHPQGYYGLQVFVFEGKATEDPAKLLEKMDDRVDVGSAEGGIASVHETGSLHDLGVTGELQTPTVVWPLGDLWVQIKMSPDRAAKLGGTDAVKEELLKVARGVERTG